MYGSEFAARAKAMGVQTLLTPFRAPKANAIAERVVRTLRNECLDHVFILNERHLRSVLAEYVAFYNTERPHRSLALEPPLPASRNPVPTGTVRSRPVLSGLHHVLYVGKCPGAAPGQALGRDRPYHVRSSEAAA